MLINNIIYHLALLVNSAGVDKSNKRCYSFSINKTYWEEENDQKGYFDCSNYYLSDDNF